MGPSTITSENTDGTINNNIREHRWDHQKCTNERNIGYTRRRKLEQKYNTSFIEHHSTQTNTNNVNKT